MRLGWLIIFFAVFSYPITISAQTPCEDIGITDPLGFNTILDEPNNNIIDVGDQFCLDFTTENFNFVVGWQFTMAFDPTIFNFIFFQQTPNVLLGPIAPNTFQAENGVLSFIWTNLNAEGQTLSDDTTIFTICFEAIGEPNDCSPFYFNDDYPFFPELEVNYQIDENTNCSDTILLINGQPATEIKIACTDLTIVDLKTCAVGPSSGSLSFSACGGDLPYTYEISNNANPVVLNGTINSDGEEAFFPTVPTAVYTIVVTDNMGNQTTRVVNIENGSPIEYDTALLEPNCPEAETGKIVIRDIRGGVPGISGYTMTASTGQFFQNTFSDSLIRLSNGDYTITIIDDNGCIREQGYLKSGKPRSHTDSGVVLKGFKLPGYFEAVNCVKKMHLKVPYFKIISWDIAIDTHGDPVFIEYNVYRQGIVTLQLANGPLFKEFGDELLRKGIEQLNKTKLF